MGIRLRRLDNREILFQRPVFSFADHGLYQPLPSGVRRRGKLLLHSAYLHRVRNKNEVGSSGSEQRGPPGEAPSVPSN